MKLYRIIVLHAGPKSSHEATETYLVADDDLQVANWIDEEKRHGLWLDDGDEEDGLITRYADDKYENEIPFSAWVMLKKGDLEDIYDVSREDAYYGVTFWGWEEVDGATHQDIERLLALGIAVMPNATDKGR